MEKRRLAGRAWLFWGAVLLLAWTGYEFVIRMQTIWWAMEGVYKLCVGEGIPFARAMTYFDPRMFKIVGYLLACVLFSIFAIALRNRVSAAYFLIVAAAAIGWYSVAELKLLQFSLTNYLQMLQLIPLLLVVVGCIANICHAAAMRRRRRNGQADRPRGREDDERRHKRRPKGRWQDVYDEMGGERDEERARDLAEQVKRRRAERKYSDAG